MSLCYSTVKILFLYILTSGFSLLNYEVLYFSKQKLLEAGKGQPHSPKGFSLIQGDFCIYKKKPQLCWPKKKKAGRTAEQMFAAATEFGTDDFGSDSVPRL